MYIFLVYVNDCVCFKTSVCVCVFLPRRPSYTEEHALLNRRLKELQRRHSEFRRLLLGNQVTSATGPALMTSTTGTGLGPVLVPGSEGPSLHVSTLNLGTFSYHWC